MIYQKDKNHSKQLMLPIKVKEAKEIKQQITSKYQQELCNYKKLDKIFLFNQNYKFRNKSKEDWKQLDNNLLKKLIRFLLILLILLRKF